MEQCLYHYGVKGMKWGVRKQRVFGRRRNSNKSYKMSEARKKKIKTALKIGGAVAATALATYGASKLIKNASMNIQIKKGQEAYNRIISRTPKYDYVSTTTLSDGTSVLRKTKGNRNIVTAVYNNPSGATKAYNEHLLKESRVNNKAMNAVAKNLEKGRNMNTIESAKNIVDYYRKKK